jgi:GTP-binding protein
VKQQRNDIRNIAIIAHVDHGKTTLVDGMLRQTNVFRQNQVVNERVLDSNDLERERGITILAKNTSIEYEGVRINLVDTPGHADFGGEVERVVNMVDGVLLLVDAVEGPKPQTRFVLRKALAKGTKVIVVVNKIDRPASRPDFVVDATFDLFVDLGATDEQADFPVIYTKALEGAAGFSPDELEPDLRPLFRTIIDYLPAPIIDPHGPAQMLVTTLEYSSYVGKIGVGRLTSGRLKAGQKVMHLSAAGESVPGQISNLYTFRDLQRSEQFEVTAGDIVAVAGIPGLGIGDTVADYDDPRPLPPITVEEPTVRMTFSVNDSPFAGQEGKYVTSRQIRERLCRELESNVSLRVEDLDKAGEFVVSGRGELHLAVLIETMRREGYEFAVSRPEVILKQSDGVRLEPVEMLYLEVLETYWGAITEMLGKRRGQLQSVSYGDDSTVYAEFLVPTRGVLGFRQPFLSATRGTGTFHTLFCDYVPYSGEIEHRRMGSLVSLETGQVSAYALQHLRSRGTFFVDPPEKVYAGQVVGEHIRADELVINVCRTKNLTGHRAVPKAIVEALAPARALSLDESIEQLHDGDLLEVTPKSLRIRKKILHHSTRQRSDKRASANGSNATGG